MLAGENKKKSYYRDGGVVGLQFQLAKSPNVVRELDGLIDHILTF